MGGMRCKDIGYEFRLPVTTLPRGIHAYNRKTHSWPKVLRVTRLCGDVTSSRAPRVTARTRVEATEVAQSRELGARQARRQVIRPGSGGEPR